MHSIKKESEVLKKIKEYRDMSENFYNKRIKILKSKNNGEFKINDFNKHLAKYGIQRELNVRESPQQNVLAGRMSFFHFMCVAADASELFRMAHLANIECFLFHSNLSF